MKRPLSLVLAAAVAASSMMVSVAPVSAQGFGLTVGVADRHYSRDNDWRWRHHHRHHSRHVAPGFYFNFGVPYPHARAYYHHRRHHQYSRCDTDYYGRVHCMR